MEKRRRLSLWPETLCYCRVVEGLRYYWIAWHWQWQRCPPGSSDWARVGTPHALSFACVIWGPRTPEGTGCSSWCRNFLSFRFLIGADLISLSFLLPKSTVLAKLNNKRLTFISVFNIQVLEIIFIYLRRDNRDHTEIIVVLDIIKRSNIVFSQLSEHIRDIYKDFFNF